jgi:hypothetical protein
MEDQASQANGETTTVGVYGILRERDGIRWEIKRSKRGKADSEIVLPYLAEKLGVKIRTL